MHRRGIARGGCLQQGGGSRREDRLRRSVPSGVEHDARWGKRPFSGTTRDARVVGMTTQAVASKLTGVTNGGLPEAPPPTGAPYDTVYFNGTPYVAVQTWTPRAIADTHFIDGVPSGQIWYEPLEPAPPVPPATEAPDPVEGDTIANDGALLNTALAEKLARIRAAVPEVADLITGGSLSDNTDGGSTVDPPAPPSETAVEESILRKLARAYGIRIRDDGGTSPPVAAPPAGGETPPLLGNTGESLLNRPSAPQVADSEGAADAGVPEADTGAPTMTGNTGSADVERLVAAMATFGTSDAAELGMPNLVPEQFKPVVAGVWQTAAPAGANGFMGVGS
ncbi:MAG: hypothetical protein IPK81_14010 [Rhodospirillales bacterium]|nr:MAG: hypothetical protein IPK81_14010 [Rhodospirillales bacterium]